MHGSRRVQEPIAGAGGTPARFAYVASGRGALQVAGRLTDTGPFQITACTG